MKKLKKKEKIFFKFIMKNGFKHIHNKRNSITFKKKHYKLSRLKYQLKNNVKLEIWEVLHHRDGNSLNDNLKNLQLMTTEEHSSLHHAGFKRNIDS